MDVVSLHLRDSDLGLVDVSWLQHQLLATFQDFAANLQLRLDDEHGMRAARGVLTAPKENLKLPHPWNNQDRAPTATPGKGIRLQVLFHQ